MSGRWGRNAGWNGSRGEPRERDEGPRHRGRMMKESDRVEVIDSFIVQTGANNGMDMDNGYKSQRPV